MRTFQRRALLVGVVPLLLLFLVPACAGTPEVQRVEFTGLRIEVRNHLDPGGNVLVYVEDGVGEPRELGMAPAEGSTTFQFEPEDPSRRYRLLARRRMGEPIVSQAFVPELLSGVVWDLQANTLEQRERGS